jgi:hypothetical protein
MRFLPAALSALNIFNKIDVCHLYSLVSCNVISTGLMLVPFSHVCRVHTLFCSPQKYQNHPGLFIAGASFYIFLYVIGGGFPAYKFSIPFVVVFGELLETAVVDGVCLCTLLG